MHMASETEMDPVPSFFIAWQVLGKSVFPLWLAEFMTEAAHALLLFGCLFSILWGVDGKCYRLCCVLSLQSYEVSGHSSLQCTQDCCMPHVVQGHPWRRTMILVQRTRPFFAFEFWRRHALLSEDLLSLRRDFPHSDKHHPRAKQSHRTQIKSLKSWPWAASHEARGP